MNFSQASVDALFTGFKASYKKGFEGAPSHYEKLSMLMPSTAREETYAFLSSFPQFREWIGDRHIKKLGEHGFTIKNKKFESTIGIKRDDVSDDQVGIYRPMFEEIGRLSKTHPDEIVFALLALGFSTECYDGQFFFDTDHPMYTDPVTGAIVLGSNKQTGTDPAWYLIDTSRPMKPMIWQTREDYKLTSLDKDTDPNVFFREELIYGVRARVNAGFGLWQMAFGSKAALTPGNYAAARTAMSGFRNDNGRRLGITPNIMLVPPQLEEPARGILKASEMACASNFCKDSAELIVCHYLD
jgi:phage major head subunit gpT-like protein